jgi:hypothetical protein
VSYGGIKRTNADIWFSKAVRLFRGECEHCHRPAQELAHFYGRRKISVRWCVMNAFALCKTCHRTFGENPAMFTEWYKLYRGEAMYDKITTMAAMHTTNTKQLRDAVAAHYREQCRLIEADPEHRLVSWN